MSVRVRMAPSPDGPPPHRQRPHCALQLALRAPRGRRVPAADREHRHRAARSPRRPSRSRSRCAGSGSTGTARSRSSSTGSTTAARPQSASSPRAGLRGRGRDPLPDAGRGDHGVRRRRAGADRVPERRASRTSCSSARDGRPTYNFASPLEDLLGRDHARHPRRRPRLEHAEADPDPPGARRRDPDLRARPERQRRGRQEALEAARRSHRRRVPRRRLHPARADQLPRPARLGAGRRDDDHVPRRARRAVHARAGRREPGDVRLRQARLDERRVPAGAVAGCVRGRARSRTSASRATTGTRRASARPRRSCRRRSRSSASSRSSPASSSTTSSPTRRCSIRTSSPPPPRRSQPVEPFTAERIETALKELCERLELKPRQAFQPIRVAVTGSKISPGLYESLELLGRDESLARLNRAAAAGA